MKRVIGVMLAVALLAVLAGAALAQAPGVGTGYGPRFTGQGMGPGVMGGTGMGPGIMGGMRMGPGMMDGMGPGMMGGMRMGPGMMSGPGAGASEQITEERANEVATEYTAKYLKGFTVERVLPITGMPHTMFQVELRGPQGETRILHITPWGGVRPFGPPKAATQ